MVYTLAENDFTESAPDPAGRCVIDEASQAEIMVRAAPHGFEIDPLQSPQTIQLAIPRSSTVQVTVRGQREAAVLATPGIVAINPGVSARVEILQGWAYQVSVPTVPAWYEPYVPGRNFDWVREQVAPHHPNGYDCGGLCWSLADEGIVAYEHARRINLWTGHPDEWMSNSIMYAGRGRAFVNGISRIGYATESASDKTCDFHSVRGGENVHRHPIRDSGKTQLEVYCIHAGRAAAFFMVRGKPFLLLLEAGDLAIVKPATTHSLIAAEIPYEHLVLQLPSTFQYGFHFKENLRWSDLGIEPEALAAQGRELIASRARGLVGVDQPGGR